MAHVAIEELLADDRFIRRLALRLMGDRDAAEDVAQEVYLKALEDRGERRARSRRGWLSAVARTLAGNARRSRERRQLREAAITARSKPPEALVVEREEVRKNLIAAILELGAPRSTVVLLRYFEELPPRAIARRLGMPVETVRTHLKRSMTALRARLSDQMRPDGSNWFAALPILVAGTRGVGVTVGTIIMTLKAKTALVGACVLLAAAGIWMSMSGGRSADAPPASGRVGIRDPSPEAPLVVEGPGATRIVPRSASESEAVDAKTALEVEVMAPDGRGAAGARVVAYLNDELIGAGDTSSDGRVRLPGRQKELSLIVCPKGAGPVVTKVSPALGRHRVTLERGAVISGVVEVDGAKPRQPVAIQIAGPWRLDKLSQAVRGALGEATQIRTTSGTDGRFEFTGLEDGSDHNLWIDPDDYERLEIVDANGRLRLVRAPQSEVVIRLHRYPVVTGRVVAGSPPVPIPKARAKTFHWPDPTMGHSVEKLCDHEGRFALPIGPQQAAEMTVTFRHPEGIGERAVTLSPIPQQDTDIGDVELPVIRVVEFVARDQDGKPVSGAVASLDNLVIPSSRTDADGRGTIRIGPEAPSFRLGSLKHEVVDVPVSADSRPITVTLLPNSGLDVGVTDSKGARAPGMMVRISGEVLHEPNRFNTIDFIYPKSGASEYRKGSLRQMQSTTHRSEDYEPDAAGKVVLAGLKPGVLITVEAIDSTESVVAQRSLTLARGTWQSVDLVILSQPRKLRGTVVDDEGRPIEDVEVELMLDPEKPITPRGMIGQPGTARSNAEGRFEFASVHAPRVTVEAFKTGYVPYRGTGLDVPPEGRELSIVLKRGNELAVTVVFDDGRPVRGLSPQDLRATFPDLPPMTAKETREGVWSFTDLPATKGKIDVTFRQQFWSWAQDYEPAPGLNEMKFVIPAPGAVAVDWATPSGAPSPPYYVRLRKVGSPEVQLIERTRPRDARSGTVTFSDVLPGEYTVELESLADGSVSVVAGPLPVTVAARQTARITLRS